MVQSALDIVVTPKTEYAKQWSKAKQISRCVALKRSEAHKLRHTLTVRTSEENHSAVRLDRN